MEGRRGGTGKLVQLEQRRGIVAVGRQLVLVREQALAQRHIGRQAGAGQLHALEPGPQRGVQAVGSLLLVGEVQTEN